MTNEPLTLSWIQFRDVMKYIDENHSFRICKGRSIKYIEPTFDMRDRRVFYIRFRGMFSGGEKEFDFRDEERQMFERIMEWLKEGEK